MNKIEGKTNTNHDLPTMTRDGAPETGRRETEKRERERERESRERKEGDREREKERQVKETENRWIV